MTCEHVALALSALGPAIVGVILTFNGVTIARGRLQFRHIGWRLAWWAAWLSFFAGIGVAAFFCGAPAS